MKQNANKEVTNNRQYLQLFPNSLSKCFNYPNSICEKNQTPWTIRYFGDLAKISRILQENIIFFSFFFFLKIWQCLTLCSSQCKRLTIARCKIKWLFSDKILFSWSIRENWTGYKSLCILGTVEQLEKLNIYL
jgi:hypothetical protein